MALFTVGSASSNPISAELEIDSKPVSMEVDTGAAVSIMSGATFAAHFLDKHLSPLTVTLKTYIGETMKVLGEVEVSVQYEQQPLQQLPLVTVEGDGPSLLGRNWLHRIILNWSHIEAVSMPNDSLPIILEKFKDVFTDGLGTIRSVKAKLSVDEAARPKFFKPRPVPLAVKPAVERELWNENWIDLREKGLPLLL